MTRRQVKIKVKTKDIPYLLNKFVAIGEDGFLRQADYKEEKRISLVFGVCGDSFALFDIKKGTIQFGPHIV